MSLVDERRAQMFPRLDQQDRFGTNVGNNVRSGLTLTTRELAAAENYRGQLWQRIAPGAAKCRGRRDAEARK